MKSNQAKINEAVKLLSEVVESWDESKVVEYPSELSSFDEVVSALAAIELSN